MVFFLKPYNRYRGKMLTVTSVQYSDDRRFENNSTPNHGTSRSDVMRNNTRRFLAIIGIGFALIMPIRGTFAQSLDAQWWQWALSIPTLVNPQKDTTGQNAVVGQRGSVWFLAGVFGGGTATRTCSVPEGTELFFPVINGIGINTPGVCGSPQEDVSDVQNDAANAIAGATNLSVTLDGKQIKNLQHLQSVFAVALPEDNVFDSTQCQVPAGIYSPAAGDGFYVRLDPLPVGPHTLRFHAKIPPKSEQDVTYNITVVPVTLK
jgi:hypothetical protein